MYTMVVGVDLLEVNNFWVFSPYDFREACSVQRNISVCLAHAAALTANMIGFKSQG